MRRAVLAALAVLASTAALAADPRAGFTYLPEPSQSAAVARSVAQGLAMYKDAGGDAKSYDGSPWWNVVACLKPVGGATFFVEIEVAPRNLPTVGSDDFSAVPTNPVLTVGMDAGGKAVALPMKDGQGAVLRAAPSGSGLTTAERLTLVPFATLSAGGCFPTPTP